MQAEESLPFNDNYKPEIQPKKFQPARNIPAVKTGQSAASKYQCDGRTHCSQMTSCEEATWFLRHCAGMKMDGNGDGIPCEKQWCK